jgi:hypothetical protein
MPSGPSNATKGRGLVHSRGHRAVVAGGVFVCVPVAPRKTVVGTAPDLDETDGPLEKPPGNQTVAAEILGDRLVEAVQCLCRMRFV